MVWKVVILFLSHPVVMLSVAVSTACCWRVTFADGEHSLQSGPQERHRQQPARRLVVQARRDHAQCQSGGRVQHDRRRRRYCCTRRIQRYLQGRICC